jgi:hypothetical protein
MMSFLSNVVNWMRKKLRISLLEADVRSLNESVASSKLHIVEIQSVVQNEHFKFDSILLELKSALIESNAMLENERRRRVDLEKQLTTAIALITNKIQRIQTIVDQQGESTGGHQEK